jgi:hypothetical protein
MSYKWHKKYVLSPLLLGPPHSLTVSSNHRIQYPILLPIPDTRHQRPMMLNHRRIAFAALLTLSAVGLAHSVPPSSGATGSDSANREAKNRVFEIRTYTTKKGKLPDLLKRFRDHTTRLFEKHGMTNIGYWTPTDKPRSENTLIYILAHDSRESAKKSWDAFQHDPDWIKARDASEAHGKIVAKVESVYAEATDFSAIK